MSPLGAYLLGIVVGIVGAILLVLWMGKELAREHDAALARLRAQGIAPALVRVGPPELVSVPTEGT